MSKEGLKAVQRELPGVVSVSYQVPRSEVPPHEHQDVLFCFLARGSAVDVDDKGREHSFSSHALAYYPPGIRHAHRIESPAANLVCTLFKPEFLERAGKPDLSNPLLLRTGPSVATLMRIQTEMASTDTASDLILEGLFLVLMGEVSRRCERRKGEAAPAWLGRASEMIRDRCLDNISIEMIARELGIHPSHLARTFRAHMGVTPGEYLRTRRLEWAARQVSGTTKPVKQIAEEAGFADSAHFSRCFRQTIGVTPLSYRHSARG